MTKEAKDAKAAKTLIWPTRDIRPVIVDVPMKYPTKYPDIIKPVAARLNSSCTALTPRSELWYHKPSLGNPCLKTMPKNSLILYSFESTSISDLWPNQVKCI